MPGHGRFGSGQQRAGNCIALVGAECFVSSHHPAIEQIAHHVVECSALHVSQTPDAIALAGVQAQADRLVSAAASFRRAI